MLRASIYKRSQGRITRQVTFAALALTIALGLWRLGTVIEPAVDPIVTAKPAKVICTLPGGRLEIDGKVRLVGNVGAAEVAVRKGDDLADIADAVNREEKATGAVAELPVGPNTKGKNRPEKTLWISERKDRRRQLCARRSAAGVAAQLPGLVPMAKAYGCDKLNLGLHFLIPAVLLAVALWTCFRLVNVPAFADFLIAVEAEMNKVSWPTRPELFRAATVVLLVIFLMGAYLSVCDLIWGTLARLVLLRGS